MADAKNFTQFTKKQAQGYGLTAYNKAVKYAPNGHLKKSIHYRVEEPQPGRFVIRITATGPDARAREYGSGVWARRGPKGKILIKPKNYPALVFPWDVPTSPVSGGSVHPNVPRDKQGRVILRKVEHPGVDAANEGEGYIGPAIRETNKLIRERFKTEGKQAIKLDIRASFRSAKRVR